MPRRRFPVEGGYFAVMAAADRGLGVAGLKSYTLVEGELAFVVCLFDLSNGSLTALIAADRLGQVRTGAASGVAAKHLARLDATSLGLIGAGWQAESQLAAIRAAVPTIERVVVSSRTPNGRRRSPGRTARRSPRPLPAPGVRHRRHGDHVEGSGAPRRLALRGRARVRHRRQRPACPRARRPGDRARLPCLLRLARGREVRVGRPDRAGRRRAARLARGAGAPRRRVGRGPRQAERRRHRRLQVERDRAVGHRDRHRGRPPGARARRRRHGVGPAPPTPRGRRSPARPPRGTSSRGGEGSRCPPRSSRSGCPRAGRPSTRS